MIPRGWRFEVDPKHVLTVDPGPSGACLVRRSDSSEGPFDAADLVSQVAAKLNEPVVLSRENGSNHASIGTRRIHEGKPRWAQIVADVSPLPAGGDRFELVVFETLDGDQYQRFAEQEAAEIFLASVHTQISLPPDVFTGGWEGSVGRSAKEIIANGIPGKALDDGWFFRLTFLGQGRYRLTRVLTSTAPIVAGWTVTAEVGTVQVSGDTITLHRNLCTAIRAPAGRPPKGGAPCGTPLGALVFAPRDSSTSLIARGVHLFDERFGLGQVLLARPRS